jgi:uncharacterized membrane protein (UPF0127 family)
VEGPEQVIAEQTELADNLISRGLGLMFRRDIEDESALVFRFKQVRRRRLHMLFVPFDIDAVWVLDGVVTAVRRLQAWWGYASCRADIVLELPAGAAAAIEPGDGIIINC